MKEARVTIASVKISASRRTRDFVRAIMLVVGLTCFIGAFFLLRLFVCADNTDRDKLRECVVGPFNR